jgi:hypothetical protein
MYFAEQGQIKDFACPPSKFPKSHKKGPQHFLEKQAFVAPAT